MKIKDIREVFILVTSILAFCIGWGLTIAGFIRSAEGDIPDNCLWQLGEGLAYCASGLGIAMYFRNQQQKIDAKINNFLHEKEDESID